MVPPLAHGLTSSKVAYDLYLQGRALNARLFITGDQFALFLDMLIIDADSGHARPFTEIAIFTVRDRRIVEERFFYD